MSVYRLPLSYLFLWHFNFVLPHIQITVLLFIIFLDVAVFIAGLFKM